MVAVRSLCDDLVKSYEQKKKRRSKHHSVAVLFDLGIFSELVLEICGMDWAHFLATA
jgi:hypothetical protein